MPAFRELILAASTEPAGSTLRVHMNNLNAGGTGTTYEIAGIDIEIESEYIVNLDTSGTVIVLEEE